MKKGALNQIISSVQRIEVHMNKPFEVCLRLVLPATANSPEHSGAAGVRKKRKGQLQTGIED